MTEGYYWVLAPEKDSQWRVVYVDRTKQVRWVGGSESRPLEQFDEFAFKPAVPPNKETS